MKDIEAAESRRVPLDLLLGRRSVAALEEPAPPEEEVGLILDAGLRAPDHGRLRPWRFVLIRGAARETFGDCLVAAAKRRDANTPQALLEPLPRHPLELPARSDERRVLYPE